MFRESLWEEVPMRFHRHTLSVLFMACVLVAGWAGAQVRTGTNTAGDSVIFHLTQVSILEPGKLGFSLNAVNSDRDPLDVDIMEYNVGLSLGLTDWLQLSAALNVYRGIEIDNKWGTGVWNGVPSTGNEWRSGFGDIWAGLKFQLLNPDEGNVGFGLLGRVKIPTASSSDGVGTGKIDVDLEGLLELRASENLVLVANLGGILRGEPDTGPVGNEFTYGIGFYAPASSAFQILGELKGGMVQNDGELDDYLDLTAGFRVFVSNGWHISLAYRRNLLAETNLAQHPDGFVAQVGYWPQKELALVTDLETLPEVPPAEVPSVELPPLPPPPPPPLAEIYFAFDKYELRPSETEKLDKIIQWLKDNPDATVVIEGHTCYIGTEEYNMALGLHRAEAVKQYFVEHGISEARMKTISYGETRPKYDNSREVTRRFNRRAWFVVKGVKKEQ